MNVILAQVLTQAHESGYEVKRVEQPRTNRWLLTLSEGTGTDILVLVQHRHLINSSDVQDLAELLFLGRFERGILLAVGGTFSPAAHRTAVELNTIRISLCSTLPTAPKALRITPAFESI